MQARIQLRRTFQGWCLWRWGINSGPFAAALILLTPLMAVRVIPQQKQPAQTQDNYWHNLRASVKALINLHLVTVVTSSLPRDNLNPPSQSPHTSCIPHLPTPPLPSHAAMTQTQPFYPILDLSVHSILSFSFFVHPSPYSVIPDPGKVKVRVSMQPDTGGSFHCEPYCIFS
jgi:hypothetical protein